MGKIEKVSEVTFRDLARYLRLPGENIPQDEINFLQTIIGAATAYIAAYTGLTAEEIDKHADMVIVLFVLCQDMYDTRTLYVDKSGVNKTVETILGMHAVNLL